MQIARRLGDEEILATVLYRAAYCYANFGDLSKAYLLQTEQVALDHRLGNRIREATGLGNLGNTYMIIGFYKQARSLFEQSMAILEALGSSRNRAFHQANVGETYLQSGDLRKARSLLENSLEQARLFQDGQGMIFTLDLLGLVLLGIGDVSGASRCYSESHQLAMEKELLPLACEAAAGRAACAAAQGDLVQARIYVQEAWDYLKKHGWAATENPATAYRTCSEVFEALGEQASAREVLESGHQALIEKADKIDKHDWRQSFLENVPENRALLDLWERDQHASGG
jgi:tetratricopeptide (TPR) repeat protein